MQNITEKDVKKAFTFLAEARRILFQQMHEPGTRSMTFVDGVDKLSAAFELIENPDFLFHVCPSCESLASEVLGNGVFHCFSCDKKWIPQRD